MPNKPKVAAVLICSVAEHGKIESMLWMNLNKPANEGKRVKLCSRRALNHRFFSYSSFLVVYSGLVLVLSGSSLNPDFSLSPSFSTTRTHNFYHSLLPRIALTLNRFRGSIDIDGILSTSQRRLRFDWVLETLSLADLFASGTIVKKRIPQFWSALSPLYWVDVFQFESFRVREKHLFSKTRHAFFWRMHLSVLSKPFNLSGRVKQHKKFLGELCWKNPSIKDAHLSQCLWVTSTLRSTTNFFFIVIVLLY